MVASECGILMVCLSLPSSYQLLYHCYLVQLFSFGTCLQHYSFAVRYHLSEDPKTLRVLPIPLKDANGTTLHYDRLCLSPDGKILATTHGSMMQWLCPETGKVLDTAEKAHDGMLSKLLSPFIKSCPPLSSLCMCRTCLEFFSVF